MTPRQEMVVKLSDCGIIRCENSFHENNKTLRSAQTKIKTLEINERK